MADRATYLLMATYIMLFGGLFVCVFGAIVFIVREQTLMEQPVAAPVAQRSVETSTTIGDTGTASEPALAIPSVRLIPTA